MPDINNRLLPPDLPENISEDFNRVLGEIDDILPSDPTSDGTYTLKCTVASGSATLSWVNDSPG